MSTRKAQGVILEEFLCIRTEIKTSKSKIDALLGKGSPVIDRLPSELLSHILGFCISGLDSKSRFELLRGEVSCFWRDVTSS